MNELDYLRPPHNLDRIVSKTDELNFDMASEPRTGALLKTLAASKPSGRFLELGTGTGIATAWLLSGMDARSTLISVDTDPNVQNVARDFLGNDDRLTLVTADGLDFLQRQPAETFDFVFADAMPGKYDRLDACLLVIKPGGFYIIDDMLPQPNWPPGHAARVPVLLRELSQRQEFSLSPLAWSSGLVIAVKTAV